MNEPKFYALVSKGEAEKRYKKLRGLYEND